MNPSKENPVLMPFVIFDIDLDLMPKYSITVKRMLLKQLCGHLSENLEGLWTFVRFSCCSFTMANDRLGLVFWGTICYNFRYTCLLTLLD